MSNKTVEFEIKVFYKNLVYLRADDAAKALGYKTQKEFTEVNNSLIKKIKGAGNCILETDYNNLLSKDVSSLSRQGNLEVTKVETLRSKIQTTISMYPLKRLFGKDYFEMMAKKYGCRSVEEYVLTYDLPEEKRKCLEELIRNRDSNSFYKDTVSFFQDRTRIDIDKLRSYGLDIQHLTSIECDGKMSLQSYIVGRGVFKRVDEDSYELWNYLYADSNGNLILPYCNYDSENAKEELINLSEVENDRDFRKYNIIDNLIWCIENLDVTTLDDYEYSVFNYQSDTIEFDITAELLIKLIRQDSISTIFIDDIVYSLSECFITDIKDKSIFELED